MPCDFPLVVVFATSTSGCFVKIKIYCYNFQVYKHTKFNKTIIPFVLVGYEIGYRRYGHRWRFTISYPMCTHGIISNYWMRLTRIWRILQIKEGVIHRGRDLQNSSYPTKAEFYTCFIIHSKYVPVLKGVSPFRSLFFRSPKITQSGPQVFLVNGSIIFSGLHFWRHGFNMTKILSKFGEQQLVMVNYACGFNRSETGKYFEWIIIDKYTAIFKTACVAQKIWRIINTIVSI